MAHARRRKDSYARTPSEKIGATIPGFRELLHRAMPIYVCTTGIFVFKPNYFQNIVMSNISFAFLPVGMFTLTREDGDYSVKALL